ncbi:MAG: TonB-dependent receptor [Candidatus Eisenbacteria bacterium]|uniref:TonB-dependent receptor n=1 Tax=Eiseniibacteriota bacterium TaxID=2212470 RepID=A0A948RZN2_UNCEI|nr:TonB-dependent receptor [Candidatus Eisenbacteria bacterium]MBU1950910.1 TonB-dependent receptor [Candidatus Eisenbacteria bacterium]MBU2692593.1 TonB-dependent receptor [Candidatus Eisenbacteria bacterium]
MKSQKALEWIAGHRLWVMTSIILLSIFPLLHTHPAIAQDHSTTQIIGKIVSSETGDPLPFANIILKRLDSKSDTIGTAAGGTFAMDDGIYRIATTPGLYMIHASYIGYHPKKVIGIEIKEGQSITAEITLVPSAIKIETVKVRSYKDETSEASILQQQRKSPAVSDGVSAEQIAKTSDSNAGEALQRVTGLTLVSGRYVYVRGLGERYSSTQVDGSTIGTPEPNKRVVPLDLFAAGLLDNIVVQKTYTPDKSGDFGGGIVNINIRDFPGHRIWSVSASSGYANMTTGKSFMSYAGGRYDFLGIDDGTRGLPDLVKEIAPHTIIRDRGVFSADTLELLGESFKNTWKTKNKKAFAPYSFQGSFGNEVQLFGQPLGFLGSISLSQSFNSSTGKEISNAVDLGYLVPQRNYDARRSQAKTLWGLIGNASYRLNSHNTISLRTMLNRSSEDEVRHLQGPNFDTTGDDWLNVRYRYVQRGILTNSIASHHNIAPLGGISVDTKFSYSRSTLDEPDRREYNYEIKEKYTTNDDGQIIETYHIWRLSTKDNSLRPTRQFGSMVEDQRIPELTVTIPFRQWDSLDSKFKMGVSYENRDRDFSWRRFYYKEPSRVSPVLSDSLYALPPEILLSNEWVGGSSSDFRLNENTSPGTDNYRGHQDITAAYAMVDMPLHHKLRIVGGFRVEDADVVVETYNPYDDTVGPIYRSELKNTDWLPSINLTYSLSKKTNLRLAASKTINRPEFREISPFNILDIEGGYTQTGNTNLKRAQIYNYDARFEAFPGFSELVAFSLFYKHLKDPIERTIVPGAQPLIQPQNVKVGKLYGAEIEARYGLGHMAGSFRNFALSGNLTLVKSETDVGDLGIQHTSKPPLQGQSPTVVNLGLTYVSSTGQTSAALIYNAFGRRLDALGALDEPDIYEVPRHLVDFTIRRQLGRYTFKFAVENILDEDIRFEQKQPIDGADKPTTIIEMGRAVSLSVSLGS